MIADPQVQIAGKVIAHEQAASAQIKFALDNAARKIADLVLGLRVNAAQYGRVLQRRPVRFRLGFDQHRTKNKRGDAADIFVGGNQVHHPPVILHRSGPARLVEREDFQVRVEAEDFFAQIVVEPAHDADDNDEHRDTERDAENGNERDDGNESPFGPQVTQRQQKFKRQFRHGAQRLKAIDASVNELGLHPIEILVVITAAPPDKADFLSGLSFFMPLGYYSRHE